MGKTTTRSVDRTSEKRLPVPREFLHAVGLTDEQIDDALQRAPLVVTPPPTGEGLVFRADQVVRTLNALRSLRHTKTRRWGGKPLDPDPWQIVWIIAPVFGFYYCDDHPDEELAGTRVIRWCWIEVPRKNGKSTLSSGLALILLAGDGEPGAEVYTAAGSRDQAGIVFEDAKKMAAASPRLAAKVEPQRSLLRHPTSGSFLRSLSRVAEAAHGLNVHGGVIDEVHVHKSRDLVDAIETGTGARDQPLIVYLTTADEGEQTSIYAEKHGYVRKQADGVVVDPTSWGVIWAAEKDDDPFALETIAKANPGFGVTVARTYLEAQAAKAQTTPSYYPTYARLHLNIRMRQAAKWFDMRTWAAGARKPVYEHELHGKRCWGGVDLGATSDFTAVAWLFDGEQFDDGLWRLFTRLYVPEAAVMAEGRSPMRSHLTAWAAAGHMRITDGDATDYDLIESEMFVDADRFDVVEVAYDPWNAPQTVQHLQAAGMTVWPMRQQIAALNAPSKQLELWVAKRRLLHGDNPVLTWMASNAVTRGDANGNIAPDKRKSEEKIDGIAALVNAVGAATRDREDENDGIPTLMVV